MLFRSYVINHHERPDEKPYIPAPLDWNPPKANRIQRDGYIECNALRHLHPPNHSINMCEVYVDHSGKIEPCCFVGNKMYGKSHSARAEEVRNIQKTLGNSNSLYYHSLREILDGDALKSYSDTWKDEPVLECWETCGRKQTGYRKINTLFVEEPVNVN